jgi:hypothetical protein
VLSENAKKEIEQHIIDGYMMALAHFSYRNREKILKKLVADLNKIQSMGYPGLVFIADQLTLLKNDYKAKISTPVNEHVTISTFGEDECGATSYNPAMVIFSIFPVPPVIVFCFIFPPVAIVLVGIWALVMMMSWLYQARQKEKRLRNGVAQMMPSINDECVKGAKEEIVARSEPVMELTDDVLPLNEEALKKRKDRKEALEKMLICPITQEANVNSLLIEGLHCYDRAKILCAIKFQSMSPMTREETSRDHVKIYLEIGVVAKLFTRSAIQPHMLESADFIKALAAMARDPLTGKLMEDPVLFSAKHSGSSFVGVCDRSSLDTVKALCNITLKGDGHDNSRAYEDLKNVIDLYREELSEIVNTTPIFQSAPGTLASYLVRLRDEAKTTPVSSLISSAALFAARERERLTKVNELTTLMELQFGK